MQDETVPQDHATETAMARIDRDLDTVFQNAPVMMHSIDNQGRLSRVNRRWSRELGYPPSRVLGRKSIELLTESSRTWAIKDTLPLFWRTGHARSVGYEFVRSDGHAVEALLDADAYTDPNGRMYSYAAIRTGHDNDQYEQADAVLSVIKELGRIKGYVAGQSSLPDTTGQHLPAQDPDQLTELAAASAPELEVVAEVLELARDVSSTLRGLLNAHEEWLGSSVEQQRELLTVARSIDRTLASLSDAGTQFAQGGGSENSGKDL